MGPKWAQRKGGEYIDKPIEPTKHYIVWADGEIPFPIDRGGMQGAATYTRAGQYVPECPDGTTVNWEDHGSNFTTIRSTFNCIAKGSD